MLPLKITIDGTFWDTQLYAGRLYLFNTDGTLTTLNWDTLIDEHSAEKDQRLALECAFRRSDYLYKPEFSLLFSDGDVKAIMEKKFSSFPEKGLWISPREVLAATAGQQNSPFPFPHASSTMYNGKMYVGSRSGLYNATCSSATKNPVSTRVEKLWDGPVFGIAASYGEIAAAAGDEGLFEIPVRYTPRVGDYTPRLRVSCTFCDWTFQNIFCSSHEEGGFLADFKKRQDRETGAVIRDFEGAISSEDIFGSTGFSWGRSDKLYLAREDVLDVVRYRPWEEVRLTHLETYPLGAEDEQIVSGAVAFFGTILELTTSILILLSDGTRYTVTGDPVSWRIFPKSKHYDNQLHVLFEDRLEIYSFNQDYFVDQRSKTFGNSYLSLEFASGKSYTATRSRPFFIGSVQPLRAATDESDWDFEDENVVEIPSTYPTLKLIE